eukprot:jgi/Chlat1/2350/Chrsp17S02616
MADDDDGAVAGGKAVRGRRHAARHWSNPYARAAPAPAPSADDKAASGGPGAAGELPPGRRWIPRLGGAVGWLWGWWHRRREDEPADDDVDSRHGATRGADDQQHDEQLDRADGDHGVEVGAAGMQEDQQEQAQPANPAVELVNILQAQKITRQQYEDCLRVLRGKFTADEPKQNGYNERVAYSPGTAGRPDQPDTARFSGEWRTPATHQRDSTAFEQLPTFQSAFRREPLRRLSATVPEYKAELAGSAAQDEPHERSAVPGRVDMPHPRLSHASEPAQRAALDEARDDGYGVGPSTDAHYPERQPRPSADGPIPYRYGGSGYYRGYSQSRYGPSTGAGAGGTYAQRYATPYTRLRPSPYMRAPSRTAPPVPSSAPAEQPMEFPPESSTGRGTTRWTPLRTPIAAPMRHKRSHETLTLVEAEQGGPARRQRRDHVEEPLLQQRKPGSPSVTTETARRILQTLDQLSSPMDLRKSLNAASTPPRQALDLATKIPRTTSSTQPSPPPPTESLTPANKVHPERPSRDRAEQGSAPSTAASARLPAPSFTPSPAPKPAFSFGLKPSKPVASGNVFSRLSPNRSPEQPVAKATSHEDKQKPGTSEATWPTTSAKRALASENTAPVFAGFNQLQPTSHPATPVFSMPGRATPSSAPAAAIDKDSTAPSFSFSEPAPVEPIASNDAKAVASDLADKVPVPTFTFASPDSSLKHRESRQEDKMPALANGGTPAVADTALPTRPLFSFAQAAPTDATKDAHKPAMPFGAPLAMQFGATQSSTTAPSFTLPSTTTSTASVFSATASLPATGLLDFLKSTAAEKDAPDAEKTPATRSTSAEIAADGVTAMIPSVKPAFGDAVATAFTFGQALKPAESIHLTPTTGFGSLSQAAASSPAVQALPPPEEKPASASLFTFGSAALASTSAVGAATSAPVLFGTTSAPLFSSAPETPFKFGGASAAIANTSGTSSVTTFTGFTFGGAPASSAAEPQLVSFGAKPTVDQVASTPAPSQFGRATGEQTSGPFTPISHQDSQPISEEMGDAAPMGMSPSSPMGTPLASVQTPPVFGLPSAATPFPFGSSSASAFGGSTPAFTAPAFGSSTQAFNAFGSSATTPAFGGSTPAFGGSAGAFASSAGFGSAPAFGGSTPGFGDAASSAPLFGAGSSTPVFGAASTPALGATSAPSFGFGSAPAFGAAFGASSAAAPAPAFGAPPSSPVVFGAPPGTPVAQPGAFPLVGAQTPPPQQSQGGFVFNAGANTPAPGGRVVRKAKRPAGAKRK